MPEQPSMERLRSPEAMEPPDKLHCIWHGDGQASASTEADGDGGADEDEDEDGDGVPSAADPDDADGEQTADERTEIHMLNKYSRLHRALSRVPKLRNSHDHMQIASAIWSLQDPLILNLEARVKHAICACIVLEEYEAGEQIFNYGDLGGKIFFIWSGEIQVEVPKCQGRRESMVVEEFVHVDVSQTFGDFTLRSAHGKRNARVSAVTATQLLALTVEKWDWCMGLAEERAASERIDFLRSAECAMFEEVEEEDLRVMAAYLREERYKGEQVIFKQGAEVDRVLFVKRGFCKIIRQFRSRLQTLNSRVGEVSEHYAEHSLPPLTPRLTPRAADSARGARPAAERGAPSPRAGDTHEGAIKFESISRQALQSLLQRYNSDDPVPAGVQFKHGKRRSRTTSDCGLSPFSGETVMIDVLKAGRYFGILELVEGLTYQCSVIANPWAEVYVITKYDLIQKTPSVILHRLFMDCGDRLSDERLMQRMNQKNAWNNYKADLSADVRNRRHGTLKSIGIRHEPLPHSVRELGEDDYKRIGGGEKLWNARAATPPKLMYADKESQAEHIFQVSVVREAGCRLDVAVELSSRDESKVALDNKIHKMLTTVRLRDQVCRELRQSKIGDSISAIAKLRAVRASRSKSIMGATSLAINPFLQEVPGALPAPPKAQTLKLPPRHG